MTEAMMLTFAFGVVVGLMIAALIIYSNRPKAQPRDDKGRFVSAATIAKASANVVLHDRAANG